MEVVWKMKMNVLTTIAGLLAVISVGFDLFECEPLDCLGVSTGAEDRTLLIPPIGDSGTGATAFPARIPMPIRTDKATVGDKPVFRIILEKMVNQMGSDARND